MKKWSGREFIKRLMMSRFDVERLELDRLICRHGMVGLRTSQQDLVSLLEKLAPVACADHPLIRMGASGDGGYLIPDDLEGIHSCFSPGVSSISRFEKDCADLGMSVFMADKSVIRPTEEHPLFNFTRKHIGVIETEEFMTMDGWVRTVCPRNDTDLLLQMDIEGAEYAALLDMSRELLHRFRIIVCEFHLLDHLWSNAFYLVAAGVFNKILATHKCLHIHPNNSSQIIERDGLVIPSIMEFTFLRKDRITTCTPARTFPHPLDADCTARPTMILPECWRTNEP